MVRQTNFRSFLLYSKHESEQFVTYSASVAVSEDRGQGVVVQRVGTRARAAVSLAHAALEFVDLAFTRPETQVYINLDWAGRTLKLQFRTTI